MHTLRHLNKVIDLLTISLFIYICVIKLAENLLYTGSIFKSFWLNESGLAPVMNKECMI